MLELITHSDFKLRVEFPGGPGAAHCKVTVFQRTSPEGDTFANTGTLTFERDPFAEVVEDFVTSRLEDGYTIIDHRELLACFDLSQDFDIHEGEVQLRHTT